MDFGGIGQTSFRQDSGSATPGSVVSRGRSLPHFKDRNIGKGVLIARVDEARGSGNMILDTLPAEMYRMLEPYLKPVVVKKEQFLYQEDDRLEFIYFPVTAVVSEFKILEDGRMVEIAVIGKEGAIGLSSLFSESRVAPNCTQVSQGGTAIKLDAVTFDRLLRSNPKLRTGLSRCVDLYIRQISQKAICNMYHSVKERLCTWLLMVHDRCGRTTLNVTHEQIARTLGVYRPSVTCIAQELRENKLINYSRGGISICDRELIEQSACACYFEPGCAAPGFAVI